MRCPECNQWNRSSLPRCIRCGAELPDESHLAPSWRKDLKDEGLAKEYIRVDEDGDIDVSPDRRELLAAEMAELKERKDEGELLQQRMREESSQRGAAPSTMAFRTHSAPADSFFGMADMPPEEEPEAEPLQPYIRPQKRDPRGTRVIQNPGNWQDSRTYDPIVEGHMPPNPISPPSLEDVPRQHRRGRMLRRMIRFLTVVLVIGVIGLAGYFGYTVWQKYDEANSELTRARVTASILDDLAAHTILIPGEEGQKIYIRELSSTYTVVGGFATIEVADHFWYEDKEELTEDHMTVTLTPYVKTTSGRQKPLDTITYDVTIPLSPIKLLTPESLRTEVTTAMYSLLFNVRPGSTVHVNGENVSDAVNENGELTYNANVQPIGDNRYVVSVRSPYCRDNQLEVVLYREVQEIPLDLAATTYTSTSLSVLPISATTLPGAEINILSPHSDLKITDLDSTGAFTFNAIFEKIGYNTITIEASYPGKKTSRVDYQIYYLPNPDVYTPKAWPLNTASDYAELLGNIKMRAERTQVYVAMGKIDHFVSEKPQMAVVYCSDDGLSQPVLLENQSTVTWKEGHHYRIYADAYSTYNGMPWLIARYTYD